ncbi:hypothetical protein [Microbacterium lacticum]|uniref:hypothetical protein n=1 Tax=Microbacterium lacticum TaxID=33885 RepID=UPI001F5A0FC2|nr:hypothetical protein [Microbacterium lacticum]
MLIVTAVLGSLLGHRIAYALFWALVALVGAVAVIVLAGARPLPRLANRSHLLHRLSWLGRYGTGAVLLCLSTFLGGVAGAAAGEGATATQFEALSALIEEVGAYAIQIAIVLLLGWLAIDMWRLNADQRITGFARVVAWAAGPEPARAISTPVVGRWVRALSSPALVSTIAIIGICYAPTLTKAA